MTCYKQNSPAARERREAMGLWRARTMPSTDHSVHISLNPLPKSKTYNEMVAALEREVNRLILGPLAPTCTLCRGRKGGCYDCAGPAAPPASDSEPSALLVCGGESFVCHRTATGVEIRATSFDEVDRLQRMMRAAFQDKTPPLVSLTRGNVTRDMLMTEAAFEQEGASLAFVFRATLINAPAKPMPPAPSNASEPCPYFGTTDCNCTPETHALADRAKAAKMRERRQREAPLVALVNAVPEGLDANGWRAAVLSLYEDNVVGGHESRLARFPEWSNGPLATLVAIVRGEAQPRTPPVTTGEQAWEAYTRALAPHKAPPPERKGATWKTRGPRLTVDRGED